MLSEQESDVATIGTVTFAHARLLEPRGKGASAAEDVSSFMQNWSPFARVIVCPLLSVNVYGIVTKGLVCQFIPEFIDPITESGLRV